jgi:hypothetical protein
MNHHSLPVKNANHDAKAILGWNHSLNEFQAHVYEIQADGLLGELLHSTTMDNFFPNEVEGLETWLQQKGVSVPQPVLAAVKDDQLKRESRHSARYDINGMSLDVVGVESEELLPMKGEQLMLC